MFHVLGKQTQVIRWHFQIRYVIIIVVYIGKQVRSFYLWKFAGISREIKIVIYFHWSGMPESVCGCCLHVSQYGNVLFNQCTCILYGDSWVWYCQILHTGWVSMWISCNKEEICVWSHTYLVFLVFFTSLDAKNRWQLDKKVFTRLTD